MEHPIKMDDLGVPLFLETPASTNNKVHSFILGGFSLPTIYFSVAGQLFVMRAIFP